MSTILWMNISTPETPLIFFLKEERERGKKRDPYFPLGFWALQGVLYYGSPGMEELCQSAIRWAVSEGGSLGTGFHQAIPIKA